MTTQQKEIMRTKKLIEEEWPDVSTDTLITMTCQAASVTRYEVLMALEAEEAQTAMGFCVVFTLAIVAVVIYAIAS